MILISTKQCNEPDNEEELTLFSLSSLYLIYFACFLWLFFSERTLGLSVNVSLTR